MSVTKRARLVLYLFMTLELILLSGYYAWGRRPVPAALHQPHQAAVATR